MPAKLAELHPRRTGNPGKWAAVSPAITQGVLAAFEGFAEDFFATALHLQGDGFGQIARKVGRWSNPTLADFADAVCRDFPTAAPQLGAGFSVSIYRPPSRGPSGWWNQQALDWSECLRQADGWMQVRHCLAHGLASGWRSERWPGPIGRGVSATSVLRDMGNGRHSLALHGAMSCARIYIVGGRHVADTVAATFDRVELDWTPLPPVLVNAMYTAPSRGAAARTRASSR